MATGADPLDQLTVLTRAAGMELWPQLELADSELRAVLAPLVERGHAPRHLADLYLVAGCLAGKRAAHAAFETSQMPVVERAVRKLGGTADELDEIKQRVRTLALFVATDTPGSLATFRGDGSLGSWIHVVALRTTYRVMRARQPIPADEDEEMFELMTASPATEVVAMKASYRAQFRSAFRTAIEALPRRERSALRMSVLDGLSIDAIAKVYSVHRATAARWLTHAREAVLVRTREAMIARLGVDESELDSIMRLIESRIEASVTSVLVTGAKATT